jgi:hypothetical protein
MIEMIGGPDRDRTDDLFHAISATSRNSLKLHDINRDETRQNAHIFPVNGPSRLGCTPKVAGTIREHCGSSVFNYLADMRTEVILEGRQDIEAKLLILNGG